MLPCAHNGYTQDVVKAGKKNEQDEDWSVLKNIDLGWEKEMDTVSGHICQLMFTSCSSKCCVFNALKIKPMGQGCQSFLPVA